MIEPIRVDTRIWIKYKKVIKIFFQDLECFERFDIVHDLHCLAHFISKINAFPLANAMLPVHVPPSFRDRAVKARKFTDFVMHTYIIGHGQW